MCIFAQRSRCFPGKIKPRSFQKMFLLICIEHIQYQLKNSNLQIEHYWLQTQRVQYYARCGRMWQNLELYWIWMILNDNVKLIWGVWWYLKRKMLQVWCEIWVNDIKLRCLIKLRKSCLFPVSCSLFCSCFPCLFPFVGFLRSYKCHMTWSKVQKSPRTAPPERGYFQFNRNSLFARSCKML